MSKKRSAFTLIEVLLYLTLNALLLMSVFSVIAHLQQTMLEQQAVRVMLLQDTAALDLVRRDILQASPDPMHWDHHELICMREAMDKRGNPHQVWIGWLTAKLHGKFGLKRIEGMYDVVAHRWQVKKHVSFFPASITKIAHQIKQDHNRCIVRVIYQSGSQPERQFSIVLKNGMYL